MLSPLPRRSDWRHCVAHPSSRISLPRYGSQVGLRIDVFEACSAFTHVTACTLALSPYVVTASPKASTASLPPRLLRLLPAGAVAGWGFHPLEKAPPLHGARHEASFGRSSTRTFGRPTYTTKLPFKGDYALRLLYQSTRGIPRSASRGCLCFPISYANPSGNSSSGRRNDWRRHSRRFEWSNNGHRL